MSRRQFDASTDRDQPQIQCSEEPPPPRTAPGPSSGRSHRAAQLANQAVWLPDGVTAAPKPLIRRRAAPVLSWTSPAPSDPFQPELRNVALSATTNPAKPSRQRCASFLDRRRGRRGIRLGREFNSALRAEELEGLILI